MSKLRVGVVLPSLSTQRAEGIDLRVAARHAEQVGLASVWHGDHLAVGAPVLDITVGLATVAAVTERISIGTSVFVPAIRALAWAAKQIASLQEVSANRLILGIGSGGGPEQWAAAGIPYADRGRRTDEALSLLPGLLAGKETLIAGHPVTLQPAVPQPPFWIGNASPVAIRRAARLGNGWFPSLISPTQVAEGATELADLSAENHVIAIGTTGALGSGVRSQQELSAAITKTYGTPAEGIPITGSPSEAAARLATYAQAGAHHIVMGFADSNWQTQCDLLAQATALLN